MKRYVKRLITPLAGVVFFTTSVLTLSVFTQDTAGGGFADRMKKPGGRVTFSGPITNRNSKKCLDIVERSYRDGAAIQQWEYADQPNQNWDIIDIENDEVAIVSRHSGKALDVKDEDNSNGAIVQQSEWSGARNQRWRLMRINRTYYRITNVSNGKCLDVSNYSRENGARVWLWDCHGKTNQQWRLSD